MKGKAVKKLIVIHQVLPYAIHDQVKELVLLVKEQGHRQVSYLLFRIFGGRDQIDGFEVSEVDVPAQDVDVKQLANVLFSLITVQVSVSKLLSYVGQLFVYSLLFQLPCPRIAKIGDELDKSSHGRRVAVSSLTEEGGRSRSRHTDPDVLTTMYEVGSWEA